MSPNEIIDAFWDFLKTREDITSCGSPVMICATTPDGTEMGILLGGQPLTDSIWDVLIVRAGANLTNQRGVEYGRTEEMTFEDELFARH